MFNAGRGFEKASSVGGHAKDVSADNTMSMNRFLNNCSASTRAERVASAADNLLTSSVLVANRDSSRLRCSVNTGEANNNARNILFRVFHLHSCRSVNDRLCKSGR